MFGKLWKRIKLRRAGSYGFYAGANNKDGDDFQVQVGHATQAAACSLERKASKTIRTLEGHKAHSEGRLIALKRRLDEILTEGRPKALLTGLVFLLMASAAGSSETWLLMPTTRGFGIAEPFAQLLAASGIVLMAGIVLKFVYSEARDYYSLPPEKRAKVSNWKFQRILLPLITIVILTGLCTLGLFRSSEMIYANQLDPSSDLGRFVGEHDQLTKLVIVFLTVMLPVAGAIALSHGIEIVRNWIEWIRIRSSSWVHQRRLDHTSKALQSANEQLTKRIAEERSYGEEIKAEYRDLYNLGKKLGMHKLPVWVYLVKTLGVCLGVTAVVYLLDLLLQSQFELPSLRWVFYGAGILAITAFFGMRQWLKRERPRPEDYDIWKPLWRDEQAPAGDSGQQLLPDASRKLVAEAADLKAAQPNENGHAPGAVLAA
jgi:hypothetical protein